MFKFNIGPSDALVRLGLGVTLVLMATVFPKIEMGWVGVYPIVTALIRWDPLYVIFRHDSRKKRPKTGSIGFNA